MNPASIPPGTAPWRLLDGYQPEAGGYDELVTDASVLRAHAEPVIRSIETMGRHELGSRWENAKRTLRDNGVTYNVYGDPRGADRPWELDMVPFLISAAEWSRLEAALLQRTRLFNLILRDIYGPQQLLKDRLLPPALVLGNPAFLRPCHGIAVPKNVHLHLHAIDLARSADGQWWVLSDRTQAPSGAGYALENRIVLSRSLPEAFRASQVQRLASFFRAYRDTLTALVPSRRSQPNVVLLTPGPYNETYFEHAYLARYLGFTLVEGGDLTIRDSRVFIKTLDGLEPVDVIFRRLDDSYCDPLELRGDSSLGIAGLVEAARAGNVTIANALGSGVLETPAVLPFLPGLCRHLLGEELRLPSVATWWCGQDQELTYVLDHLDALVVKRAFPAIQREPVFANALSAGGRQTLASELRARPSDFVGQEQVKLSSAPVWQGQHLEPRAVVLRTYVAAAGDSFMVMPGGLSRVAASRDSAIVSMQRGGGSKDTWVLSDRPVIPVTLLAPMATGAHRERRATDLSSRVADNLFWLGRQAERAEHTVRLLRSTITRLGDDSPELAALLQVVVRLELLPAALVESAAPRNLEHEVIAALVTRQPPSALQATLNELHRLTSMARDRLSIDTSRILTQLHQDFQFHRRGRLHAADVVVVLNRTIIDLAAFSGMEMENMTRGYGWRFLDVGRRLERSLNLTSLLRATIAIQSEVAILEPLLEIADSSMTYRRRYFARPQLAPVLDLLLTDGSNTRALAFQLAALAAHARHLPRDSKAPAPVREDQLLDHAVTVLTASDVDVLGRPAPEGGYPELVELLDTIDDDLRALSDTLTFQYFSHAEQHVS
jgi:uncharacterized circularly permuted ATP-grasp superfamily protein/uncharacterized alpha-E superfamily protein